MTKQEKQADLILIEVPAFEPRIDVLDFVAQPFVYKVDIYLYSKTNIEHGNVKIKVVLHYDPDNRRFYFENMPEGKQKSFYMENQKLVPAIKSKKPFSAYNLEDVEEYIVQSMQKYLTQTGNLETVAK